MEFTRNRNDFPAFTIAICTRERPSDLIRCLKAVSEINYPDPEILVVDNAPLTTQCEDLIKNDFNRVRYTKEICAGLNRARNRAVLESSNEIIGFLDDDTIVDQNWALRIVKAFKSDPEIMGVTGLVLPYEVNSKAQILFEKYGGFQRGNKFLTYDFSADSTGRKSFTVSTGLIGTGANMAFRKRIFDQIGLFDPVLGAGTPTGGGDDLEYFFRILNSGYRMVYEPGAIVYHRHRRSYEDLKFQLNSWGKGSMAYLIRIAQRHPDSRSKIIFYGIMWFLKRHVYRFIKKQVMPQRLPFELLFAEFRGVFQGIKALKDSIEQQQQIEKQGKEE